MVWRCGSRAARVLLAVALTALVGVASPSAERAAAAAPPPDPAPAPPAPPAPPAAPETSAESPVGEDEAPADVGEPTPDDEEEDGEEEVTPAAPPPPEPVPPGEAGADLRESVGRQVARPAAPAATVPSAAAPASPPPATDATTTPVTPAAGPDDASPAEGSDREANAGRGAPLDGLLLLLAILAAGVVVGMRALRGTERRVGAGLVAFCAAYLAILAAVVAGVAEASPRARVASLAPPAPARLAAVATSPRRVDLSWELPPLAAGVTGFRVSRDGRTVADLDAFTAAYSDRGVAPATTYRYRLEVLTGGPEAPRVLETTVRTPPIPPPPDVRAPAPIRSLRADVNARRVRLRWRLPADADRVRVLVVRRLDRFPRGPRDGVRVLDRPATWLADHPLSPRRVFYLLYAVDRAGNRSRPVRGSVRRFWPPLLGPIDDARVGRRPLLRWRRAPRAAYYNVQVWRGTAARKVVTTWPVRTSYRVPSRLRPGRYTWYVYPGFGERRAARYGRLLGSATFVVR